MTRRPAARRRDADPELRRSVDGSLREDELDHLEPTHEVDALGTFCPEPVIRTQNRMATMSPGETLRLLADDAGVEVDIPAWCISTRNEYLGVLKEDDLYQVFVRKT